MAIKKDKIKQLEGDYKIIREPIITEKSALIGGAGNVVAFRVDMRASKTEIAGAVERLFNVEVDKVRTSNFLGKLKKVTRASGRRASFKKAYVTLKPGFQIDLMEGV